MTELIILIIIGCAIYWGISELKRKAESAKNFILGEKGHCVDCKYCKYDPSRQFSSTDIFVNFQNVAILLMIPSWIAWRCPP